ncbi:hypothetical protein ACHAXT_006307 [Thalassiosira profunda]
MTKTPAFVLRQGEEAPTNHPEGAGAASVAGAVKRLVEQLPEKTERRAARKNLDLFMWSGCILVKGEGNVMAKLLSGAHLHVFPWEWDDGITDEFKLMIEKGIFVSEHSGRQGEKSRWFGTGGPGLAARVNQFRKKYSPSLRFFVNSMKEMFNASVTTEFVVNYPDAESNGEVVGFMLLHDDDFEADLRGMATIGGKGGWNPEVKKMTFEDVETGERDTITIPHGTVVVMDRIAAGAVKEFQFKHGIEDAEGTYTYGFQMNVKASVKSLAVDDSTEENGCLRYVPGSGLERKLRRHAPLAGSRDEGHALKIEVDESKGDVIALAPCMRGSVTVHDEFVVHGSGGNNSPDKQRRTYVLAYRPKAVVEAERRIGFTHSHNDKVNWDTFDDGNERKKE